MKEQNQQFGAITPEGADKKEPDKKDGDVSKTPEAEELYSGEYFQEKEDSCVYLGVEVPKGSGGELVPNKKAFEDYFYTKEDYILMRELATSMKLKQPLIVEGGTGIGKTSAVKRMCADLNMNYGLVSFSESTDLTDVIGHKDIVIEDGEEKIKWFDGYATKIIREGGVLFLDEYNFQGGKIGGRINPIIDSILNGDKTINLTENDNELIQVHPDLVLVAAQNPPGTEDGEEFTGRDVLSAEKFGRWTFHKLAGKMSKEMEQERMLGMVGMDVEVDISQKEYRVAGEGIPLAELKDIPGMIHWIGKYTEIREMLESKVRDRSMGRQAQKIYFNPRLGQKLLRYVAEFYRGDINEVWKNAFEYYIEKMFKSEEDKEKIRATVEQSEFIPPKKETKRKGLGRDKKGGGPDTDGEKTPEELEKEKTLAEIEEIKKKIKESGKTPKEWFGDQTIQATTPEGKEIKFELNQILEESINLYKELNLAEWTKELPETITLSEEQINKLKEQIEKHGFNRMKIFPSVETQQKTLKILKTEANQPMKGLDDNEQYKKGKIDIWGSVEPHFPDGIRTKNRPKGIYIQLYKDDGGMPGETLKTKYTEARKIQKENNLQGYTLPEYLIFQREFTKENKKHPEHNNWTWLTDSEIGDLASAQVLYSYWHSDVGRVLVGSFGSGFRPDNLGFRSSAVLPI